MRSDVINKSILHLHYLMEMLEKHQIKAWIDFGTLLGAYREKTFIAHDMDIDIGILSEDVPALENLLTVLREERKILGVDGGRWDNGEIYQFGFNPRLIKVDIYVYGSHGTKVSAAHFKGFSFHRFYIDNLEKIKFGNYLFNCPRHLPQYLSLKYGEDYMTPQVRCEKLNVSWDAVVDNVGSDKEYYTAYLPLFNLPIDSRLELFCRKIKSGFDKLVVGLPTDEPLSTQQLTCSAPYAKRLEELKAWVAIDAIAGATPLDISAEALHRVGADYLIFPRNEYDRYKKFLDVPETQLHLLS